jgi:hypothetical protein
MVPCSSGTLDYGPLDVACDERHARQHGAYLDVQQPSPASAQQQIAQISLTLYISGGEHIGHNRISVIVFRAAYSLLFFPRAVANAADAVIKLTCDE